MVHELRNDARYAPYLLTAVQLHTSYFGYDCHGRAVQQGRSAPGINTPSMASGSTRRSFRPRRGGARAPSTRVLGYDPALRGNELRPAEGALMMRQAGSATASASSTHWTDEFNNSGSSR